MHAEANDGLLGCLPEELVIAHVLSRLPWYTRPVCRATSKSWRALIDNPNSANPQLQLKTRQHQVPLLRGLFLICTSDCKVFITRESLTDNKRQGKESRTVPCIAKEVWNSSTSDMRRHWRRLPPLPAFCYRSPNLLLANSGRVYACYSEKPETVMKLDLGCGEWTWKKIPVPHRFHADAVDFNGKIYVPGVFGRGSPNEETRRAVLVCDMMTDQCAYVDTWYHSDLRVLLNNRECDAKETLYSLSDHRSGSDGQLGLLVYNACEDSWGTYAEIPRHGRKAEIELLNGDCFEPALETCPNVVWFDYETKSLRWFDASVHKAWIHMNYDTKVEGIIEASYMESINCIRGSLYGIFCVKFQGKLFRNVTKRIVKKGRLQLASRSVVWEDVLELGCLERTLHHSLRSMA